MYKRFRPEPLEYREKSKHILVNPRSEEGKIMKTLLSVLLVWILVTATSGNAADNMKAFPPAESGAVRYVLNLPKQDDEKLYKVEIIVGKTVQVDEANAYFFGGEIESKNIDGWGFTRYVVSKLGPMAGTLVAVNPNAPKVDRFVTLGGEPYIIRYNSRLPVVVYVPDGVEVRYRVWTAAPKSEEMQKG